MYTEASVAPFQVEEPSLITRGESPLTNLEKEHPFQEFLYALRDEGVPAATGEWLDMQSLLDMGEVQSLDEFYVVARAVLVKDVTHYPKFDTVFGRLFYDIEPEEITEDIEDDFSMEDPDLPGSSDDLEEDPDSSKSLEKSEMLRNSYEFAVSPAKFGYYVSRRSGKFNSEKLTWTFDTDFLEEVPLESFQRSQEHVHVVRGSVNSAVLNFGLPIPEGYSLEIAEMPPGVTVRKDAMGAYLLSSHSAPTIEYDLINEVTPQVKIFSEEYYAESFPLGDLPQDLETLLMSLEGTDTTEFVDSVLEYIQSKYEYPTGANEEERLQNALLLQQNLRENSLGEGSGHYISSLAHSHYLECLSANTLFLALCRNRGIPSRMVFGDYVKESTDTVARIDDTTGHAWIEIWNGSEWVRRDATPISRQKDLGIPPEKEDSSDPNDPKEQKKKDAVEQKEEENIDEVEAATSKTTEDKHGGDEATKDIEDSQNPADAGKNKDNKGAEEGVDSTEGAGHDGEGGENKTKKGKIGVGGTSQSGMGSDNEDTTKEKQQEDAQREPKSGKSGSGNQKSETEGKFVGGKGNYESARTRVLEHNYDAFEEDRSLSYEHFGRALSKLRTVIQETTSTRTRKLDARATAFSISKHGGAPELLWKEEVEEKPNVILMFDVGGGTDEFRPIVSKIFSAAQSEFAELKIYFFHNAIYGEVWTPEEGNFPIKPIFLEDVLKSDPNTKVIIIGDPCMGHEDPGNGGFWDSYNEMNPDSPKSTRYHDMSGEGNFYALASHFSSCVYIDTASEEDHAQRTNDTTTTKEEFEAIFSRFPLTLRGLEDAITKLMEEDN